jgi:hypothetical protein
MAENGSIYLVTGCDKGPEWGITAFSNLSGETDVFLNFTAAQLATASVSYLRQWKVESPAAVRTGPSAPDWQTLQGPSNSDQQTARQRFTTVWNNLMSPPPTQPTIENQCIFARGHYIWLGGGLLKRLRVRPAVYVTPDNKGQNNSRDKVIPFFKGGCMKSSTVKQIEPSITSPGHSGSDNIDAREMWEEDDGIFVETLPNQAEVRIIYYISELQHATNIILLKDLFSIKNCQRFAFRASMYWFNSSC